MTLGNDIFQPESPLLALCITLKHTNENWKGLVPPSLPGTPPARKIGPHVLGTCVGNEGLVLAKAVCSFSPLGEPTRKSIGFLHGQNSPALADEYKRHKKVFRSFSYCSIGLHDSMKQVKGDHLFRLNEKRFLTF